jgi:hypothetical protein
MSLALPRLNGTDAREMWVEAVGRAGFAASSRFRLEPGAQVRLPEPAASPPAVVTGTVRDAGKPVAGATLVLRAAGELHAPSEAITGRDGRFRLVGGEVELALVR